MLYDYLRLQHRSYSNVFGLEPNYPCCTVNHPQGFSKFISNAFVVTPDSKSLIHVYLGPFSVKTVLANGMFDEVEQPSSGA